MTVRTSIDRRFVPMSAAGWHFCFDVLDYFLAGTPLGRIVGPDAMKFDGWPRLHAEYATQFGVEAPPANSCRTANASLNKWRRLRVHTEPMKPQRTRGCHLSGAETARHFVGARSPASGEQACLAVLRSIESGRPPTHDH